MRSRSGSPSREKAARSKPTSRSRAPVQVRQQRAIAGGGEARGHAVQGRAQPRRIHQHQHRRRGLRRGLRRIEVRVQHALGCRDIDCAGGDGHAAGARQRRATVSTTSGRTTTRVPLARAVRSAAASAAM